MTPSGIEPVTFQFVAQHLNHCATMVLIFTYYGIVKSVISGSLSPQDGMSSGCGWRNGLQIWRITVADS